MNVVRIPIILLAIFATMITNGLSQNAVGKWTIGVHGGANTWISDYNRQSIGEGGEVMLRYGINEWFSAAAVGGYEELRAEQFPITMYPWLTSGYIKLHAIPLSMIGYVHFAPTSGFNPFIYAGLGAMLYKRVDANDVYIPNSEFSTTVHVPLGIGFEVPASRQISVVVDLGYHVTDDYTDYIKGGNLGSFVTGKIGFNFLLGNQ